MNDKFSKSRQAQEPTGVSSGAKAVYARDPWSLHGVSSSLNLSSICYVDLGLLRSCVVGKVERQFLQQVPSVESLEDLRWDDSRVLFWCIDLLAKASLIVSPLSWESLRRPDELPGQLLSVSHHFRTKNVGCWRRGDYRIGKVYCCTAGMTLHLVIDPGWVVPGHGHSQLAAGHVNLGGIFVVEAIDEDPYTLIGRPVILGDPVYAPWASITGNRGFTICHATEHR